MESKEKNTVPCFKAYDIRGRIPDELNRDIAFRLGQAYAAQYRPKVMALGRDMRLSSPELQQALALGLESGGVEVLDLGLSGTEEAYWAAQQPGIDGAIAVTASHNPADFNGMKLVRGGAVPISGDSGLRELEARVAQSTECCPDDEPRMTQKNFRAAYVEHLLGYVERRDLRPLKIVVNPGNGAVGPLLQALEPHLPFDLVKLHFEPDGTFPNGIPNPLLPENRSSTSEQIRASGADFGVAWDGDFDRCFLFDERGEFIEGYYIVGLLAESLVRRAQAHEPRPKVIHDPRLTWNTIDMVEKAGGQPIQSKTGHAFIKERMRAENAIYGGEMSAHHYFREFGYCDNGNIPWLLVAEMISTTGKSLSQLIGERVALFPCSGEINRKVNSVRGVIDKLDAQFSATALKRDTTDGISLEFADWRFNLRGSNTEPLLRLNVEARGDVALMQARRDSLLEAIAAADT